jgi:glycosyltransferase involved in cell wall biosynthesis
MKTTIITLTYNHERYIREALGSALAQTQPADEIIVVDDASPDGTAAAIVDFLSEHPGSSIRFIRNKRNLGLTGSFEKAVAMASGDILIMMTGDDVSAPNRLERCVAYLSAHPSTMALITNADVIDGESRPVGVLDNCAGMAEPVALGLADIPAWGHFLRGRSSCGAAAAYRAEVFRSFSPLSSGLYAEDDPAAFRAMLLGTCDFLPERLVGWRRHANNLSYGTGVRRGPEMAVHYRKCEAMVEEMLADVGEWIMRYKKGPAPWLDVVTTTLRFHKAKWALWAAAHEQGLSLTAFFLAAKDMAERRPPFFVFLREIWRPSFRMFMPFSLQRLMANLRSRI